MTIIRAPREERFTILNRTIINDDRLSYRALGLLVFLLDKPDNWRVEASDLARGEGREGRDAVRTALTELAEIGYLVRRRLRNDKGQWLTETYLYDTPGHTDDGNPGVGAPANGSPGALTKTVCDDGNEDSSPPTPRKRGALDEQYDNEFAPCWSKRTGLGAGRKIWRDSRKMTAVDRLDAIEGAKRHCAWWAEHETDKQFIPAMNVWLNQRRWEEDEPRSATVLQAVPANDWVARSKARLAAYTENQTVTGSQT